MFQDGEQYTSDGYFSDVITDNAIEYLDGQKSSDNPFSMNVHYTAPHAPWGREQHPSEIYNDYFDNCTFDSVRWDPIHPNHLLKEGSSGSIGETADERRKLLSGYFAAITAMDDNIGRLIDWLEANDLRENTLVVFTADNGMSMGHHGIWGKGNGTYPANMYDTAVKVPALMSRPGHVPQGEVEPGLLSHYDLMPTILDYVRLGYTIGDVRDSLPGTSFAATLEGAIPAEDLSVIVADEYGPTRMIRTKSLKYIHRYPDGPNEFYDLGNDPNETVNAIDDIAFRSIIRHMAKQLQDWFEKYVEPERDGSKQDVKGRGQIYLVGGSEEAFAQDVTFVRDL
jgi:arylsulfatase A-like enzyme